MASKATTVTTAGISGRAITRSTMRPQMPPPSPPPRPMKGILSRFTLSPSIAMRAGRRVMERITAKMTTTMAARPRLAKTWSFTRNRPATAKTVVAPANTIALPDVPLAT